MRYPVRFIFFLFFQPCLCVCVFVFEELTSRLWNILIYADMSVSYTVTRGKVILNNPLWPVKWWGQLWRHTRSAMNSVLLYACVFVCDNRSCKNNDYNLQRWGTCDLIGFEMLLLIFVHLQFRHLHKTKHDMSALSISLHLYEIHWLSCPNCTVIAHWLGHVLRMCAPVHVMFTASVCLCTVWTSIFVTSFNGFCSWEDHYNGVWLPQP